MALGSDTRAQMTMNERFGSVLTNLVAIPILLDGRKSGRNAPRLYQPEQE